MQRTLPSTRFASTKREAAAWLGVSVVTLDAWLAKGCPSQPGRGPRKEIGFDLMEVCRWRFGAPVPEGGRLDPAQEKAALDRVRREQIEDAIRIKRRELIGAEEFRTALSASLKVVATGLEGMPEILERDCHLDGATVERIIAVLDRLREDMYHALCESAGDEPKPPE
jgi:phage terminase Nu1 subunit (DNA packaging protein)